MNPPIRAEADREALWEGVLRGEIDWVCSDHACCSEADKLGDMWAALPGFGGSALMYPYMLTEGPRRGLGLERIVELVSEAPARAYGLFPRKGRISVGSDADLAIVDLDRVETVTPARLLSAQDHTPFAGLKLTGWPVRTILRGRTVLLDGAPVGEPRGAYLWRTSAPAPVGA
ncbi:MAG TPA: dihydroorotase family protein [Solirubrobacteraceae bacterium]|nr:dihydroorotase family protein [Solirubrobacteraceae bacterium]